MKKIALTLATIFTLSACGSVNTGALNNVGNSAGAISKNLFGMYVQNQCVGELQSRNEWRVIALAMSQAQQTEWENKICGCVSDEALNQMTAADAANVLTGDNRMKVITEVGARTVTACFKKIYTK